MLAEERPAQQMTVGLRRRIRHAPILHHETVRPGGCRYLSGQRGPPIMAARAKDVTASARELGKPSIRERVTILPQVSQEMIFILVSIETFEVAIVFGQWRGA